MKIYIITMIPSGPDVRQSRIN